MMAKRLTTRRIERQLRSVVLELAAARERVVVAKQQYEAFRDDDEEAQTRSLGSEMVEDRHVADQARRHAELMRLAVLRAEVAVAALEKSRDELLARYEPAG
jgi:DNA transposition AAA+ family ATPase